MKPAPEKITRRRALRAILAALAAPFFRGAARAESTRSAPFHHLPDGTFRNNHIGAIDKPFADLLKWRRESPGHPLKAYSVESPAHGLFLRPEIRTLTWAGHATFLLRAGGMSVLTDPHFSMRAVAVFIRRSAAGDSAVAADGGPAENRRGGDFTQPL